MSATQLAAKTGPFELASIVVGLVLLTDLVLLARWVWQRAGATAPPRPLWSLAHPFVAFQLALLGAGLAVGLGSAGQPASPEAVKRFPEGNDPATVGKMLLALIVQNVLFVVVTAVLTRRYGSSLAKIGLRRPTRREVLFGLGAGSAVFAGALLVSIAQTALLRGLLSPVAFAHLNTTSAKFSADGAFLRLPSVNLKFWFALVGAIVAPVGEEVFFRGLVYNALKARYRVPLAIVGSALLFALVHISPLSLLVIFLTGLSLAAAYERTGSLAVTILMHVVNNSLAFVLLVLAPALT